MAGDWIKVEKATPRKPEVLRMADILSIHPDHAFGLCVRFWFWCDDNMTDGHAPSVTYVTLDSVFGHAGFTEALLLVGWLVARNGSLQVPNFDRHLSESAKNRALSGERKRNQRSRAERDKNVTREEKRRDRKKVPKKEPTTIPELLQTPEFSAAWKSWEQHRSEKKSPLTPTTVVAQLKMLARMGPERAVAAIEHTIFKGWTGLKEPDADDKPPPPRPPPVNAPPPPKRVSPVNFKNDPYATKTAPSPPASPPVPPPPGASGEGRRAGAANVDGATGGAV
ncbi:MAG TPA: hypothetical protein VFV87_08075 [Pirellulaceae bacterium]|nr:hypothetical protein [Pirellulaceae bacterium]